MTFSAAMLLALTVSAERSMNAAAGGRFETLVGVVPTGRSESEASVAFTAIPVVGLQVTRQRYHLSAIYRPRLYWRFPNPLDLNRPLLLHQGDLAARYDFTRRTSWQLQLGGSVGEVDYTLASYVFGPTEAAVPDDQVTDLVRATGSTGFGHAFSSRAAGGLTFRGVYNAPLNPSESLDYRRSTTAEVEPFVGFQWSTRDRLGFYLGAGYAWYDSESTFFAGSGGTRYEHEFTRRTSGRLSLGATAVHVLDAAEVAGATEEGATEVTPTGEIGVTSMVYGKRGVYLNVGGSGSYQWYFDPVLGFPVQRAGGAVQATLDLPPDWGAYASVAYYTTVGSDEFEPAPESELVRPDRSILRIATPIYYDIDRYWGLEFGVRSTFRGPPIEEGFGFDRVEVWGYGAVRVVLDPRDQEATWVR